MPPIDQEGRTAADAADAPDSLGSGDFDAHYYAHDCGRPYQRDEHWLGFFQRMADGIVERLTPSTTLDAGCAMGFLVEGLHNRGVDARGVDVSEYAIERVDASIKDRCWQASLVDPLPDRYDLITCIEVLEHLSPTDAERALANLCAASDRVLFSSSPLDYSEPTHVNVRPPEEWSVEFARHGFLRNLDVDLSFVTPWAVLYERSPAATADLVRRYDRAVARLSLEVNQVRTNILQLQERLAEAERVTPSDALTEHLEALVSDAEALFGRRDTIIGLEAQLGEALGRVRELEAEVRRMKDGQQYLDEVLASTTWRLTWKLMGPYRRFRGRQ